MKAVRTLLVLVLLVLLSFGRVLSQEGEKRNLQNERFLRGNEFYERGRYDSAVLEYEAILCDSLVHEMLYYNLGNSYFRLQQYPKAILNYERALKLNSRNANAEFNLALARTFTVDKLVVPEPFPLVFLWRSFCNGLSLRGWVWLSILAFFLLALSILLLRFFVSREQFRRLLFVPSLFLLVFVMSVWMSVYLQNRSLAHEEGVIMQPVVSIKGSPDVSSKDLFLLHAGTKVEILQHIGTWYEIVIPDGHQGWVEENVLQVI